MNPDEVVWWQKHKKAIYGANSYKYALLLQEGRESFSWSKERVNFLMQWWWSKFGEKWKRKRPNRLL
jgi:hypothetical protein